MTTFARRATDGSYWLLAIALLGVYCVLQGYGERERRAALALFFQPDPIAAEPTAVEPTDRSPDALTNP
jgi:hypothetical protein